MDASFDMYLFSMCYIVLVFLIEYFLIFTGFVHAPVIVKYTMSDPF